MFHVFDKLSLAQESPTSLPNASAQSSATEQQVAARKTLSKGVKRAICLDKI